MPIKNNLMAQYLRDPRQSYFQEMLEAGSSTAPVQSPWQGVARMVQGGLGGLMAAKLRGEYEKKGAESDRERRGMMAMATGQYSPESYEDGTTINWMQPKDGGTHTGTPDYMRAAALASSPDNEDLATTMFGAKINQDQTLQNQQFQTQQQQAGFKQERQLAEITAARQMAAQNAMLDRQMKLEQWKMDNDPLKKMLQNMGQESPTLGQVGVQSPTQQGMQSQADFVANALFASKGLKAPEGFMFNQQGQVVQLPAGQQKLTDEQAKALGFVSRMQDSDKIISRPDITQSAIDVKQSVKSAVPFFGNALVSPEYQQYDQASRDFVNAVLRRESGAAISPSEFESAKQQYFPQPFDKPEVIKQKQANRQSALESIMRAGGSQGREMLSKQADPRIQEAKDAIARGANPEAVKKRLVELGLSMGGL